MKLPPKLTRQLCKATCDKKDWDRDRGIYLPREKLCKALKPVCPSHKHCHKK